MSPEEEVAEINRLREIEEINQLRSSAKPKPIPPTIGETAMRMGSQGLTRGHADEMTAGVGALYDTAQAGLGLRGDIDLSDAYETRLKPIRKADEAAREANPKTAFVTELAGGLAPALVAGPAALAGGTARGVGLAMLGGAATGSGYSEADNLGDYAKDVGLGAGLGAAGYGVAKAGGKAIGGGIDAVGDKASSMKDEIAEWLTKKADQQYAKTVTGHSKKALKELSRRSGGIEAFGRDARNEGLVKFGDTVDNVAERAGAKLEEAKGLLNSAYSQADSIDGQAVDPLKIRDRILQIAADNDVAANQKAVDELLKHAEYFERLGASKGGISLSEALKQKSGYKFTPNDPSAILSNKELQNKLKSAVGSEMVDAAEGLSARPGAEAVADQLKEGNRLYGIAKPAVKAAEDRKVGNLANNMLSPSDKGVGLGYLLSQGADAVTSPVKMVTGLALGAANNQIRTRSSSMAAVTADKVAELLKSAPEALGPYAKMLQSAQEKGARSLGVTHEILMKNDPDYAKAIQRNFGGQ